MLRAIAIGLPLTVLVTILALMIGTVVALPIVAGLRSKNRILWLLSRALVDLLRGVPPVVWLFILYYGVSIGAIRLTALQAGVLGLGVVAAAYLAEIFRGAISSIPKGQWEASSALGFHRATVWSRYHRSANGTGRRPGLHYLRHRAAQGSSIASSIGVAEIVFMSSQTPGSPARASWRSSWLRAITFF